MTRQIPEPDRRPLSGERDKKIVLAIGDALSEAAKVGVIHRDVSPKNVLLMSGDAVKVINFGVPVPVSPKLQGEPEYVSPEQRARPMSENGRKHNAQAAHIIPRHRRGVNESRPRPKLAARPQAGPRTLPGDQARPLRRGEETSPWAACTDMP